MSTQKLSAITPGGIIVPATDQLVGVRSGTTDVLLTPGDPISSIYPVFTPTGSDDEFTASNFPTGWTAIGPGTHNPTITESNNVLSVLSPGGDAANALHAWAQAPTITTGSSVETSFRCAGIAANFIEAGVFFADGTTYTSGKQLIWLVGTQASQLMNTTLASYTGYNTQVTGNNSVIPNSISEIFLRLVYNGSNSWSGYISPDGISWALVFTMSYTMTPTVAGFFVSTNGASSAFAWSFRYVKFR